MKPADAVRAVDLADDAALVRRIAATPAGQASEAEAELYRRLAPRVRLFGLRHLRSKAAAGDLTQQVLLAVLLSARRGRVREPDRLGAFVSGVCRLVLRDLRRGSARRRALLERFAGDVPTVDVGPPADVDGERLAGCLGRLPERERSVVMLTFHSERTTDEVAMELGLSPGNVRVIRHRALERLRRCMTGEDGPS